MKWNQQIKTVFIICSSPPMHVEPRSLKNCNQANFLTCFSSGLTPSIDTGVAILFQEEFSQPSLLMPIASHPLIEQGEGGAKIQESAAYETNKLCCPQKLPRTQTTRKIKKQESLIGITTKSLTS
jgi:hypothetical protein